MRGDGGVDDDGADEVADVGGLAAGGDDADAVLAHGGEDVLGAADERLEDLAGDERLVAMVEERRMFSTQPMQRRSSVFMMTASWAMPRHTLRSPVSFQYMYAREDLVPAPSACMQVQYARRR